MIRLKNTAPNTLLVFLGLFPWLATILLAMPVWADEQAPVIQKTDEPRSIHEIETDIEVDSDKPAIAPAAEQVETELTGEAAQKNESTNETVSTSETTQLIEAV